MQKHAPEYWQFEGIISENMANIFFFGAKKMY